MSKKDEEKYKPRSERNKEKHRENQEVNENVQNRKGFFIVLVILFAILLFLLYLIFSGGGESDQAGNIDTSSDQTSIEVEESSDTAEETETSEETESEDTSSEEEDTEEESDTPDNPIEEQNADNNLEEVEPSDDAVAAYEGDWDPIGTEQTGPRGVVDYSDNSQDRLEIKAAAAEVTGLNPDTLIERWVGNDGTEQGVYATVTDPQQTQVYRVHLRWNDSGGWQPLSVEILE